ncbi:unnamed protein product [Lota lota]
MGFPRLEFVAVDERWSVLLTTGINGTAQMERLQRLVSTVEALEVVGPPPLGPFYGPWRERGEQWLLRGDGIASFERDSAPKTLTEENPSKDMDAQRLECAACPRRGSRGEDTAFWRDAGSLAQAKARL